ncbi:MAG: hypothetical protein EZS28_020138 [Streblomastix strix]|uniref:Uncharacterized protein n=1 Tax=Streblomastix strix TaxID=222440 RepID=A0A5J4VPT1_9EUKA|nr:MAG: hypothetical protein EZS28_020138 [Streblomastix strix]
MTDSKKLAPQNTQLNIDMTNEISQDIGQLQADVQVINTELARQTHFRGYFTTNDEILELTNPAIGDYAYSAEDLLVWDYDGSQWVETDKIVPDQMTPASDANPLSDGTVTAGTSTEYSRGDHIHPLNISTSVPISDTADGAVGTSVNYSRSDHSHPINISSTTPLQDNSGSVGTANSYARSDHQHTINVETNASNIPQVDGVGVNGTSTYYSRHDHVHPQQLTYDGNVTATKFIKTGGTNQQILIANGDTKAITDFNTSVAPRAYQIDPADGIYWMCFAILNISNFTSNGSYGCTIDINTTYVTDFFYLLKWNLRIQNGQNIRFEATQLGQVQTDFMLCADTPQSSLILRFYMKYNITTDTLPTGSLFASTAIQNRFTNNNGKIIACDPNSSTGTLTSQWNISVFETGELKIGHGAQVMQANKGLMISADGNTLSFNGTVIAGTGASTGGDSSVTYSQGKAVQWGTNSTQSGGLYASGQNLYWNARTIAQQLGHKINASDNEIWHIYKSLTHHINDIDQQEYQQLKNKYYDSDEVILSDKCKELIKYIDYLTILAQLMPQDQ